jgi:YggT family protein
MGPVLVAANFLINTLVGLYVGALMLRFILGQRRADFRNPLAQFVVRVTNPALIPLRRVLPPVARLDTASLALMTALVVANLLVDLWLMPVLPLTPLGLATWTLLRLAQILCNLWFFTVLLEALLSWTSAGGNPMAQALRDVNQPLLTPFRRLIKPVGGFDLSPLFALLGLQVLNILNPLHPWLR